MIFVRLCTYVHYLHTLAGTLDECLLVCCEFMFEKYCYALLNGVGGDDVSWCSQLHWKGQGPSKHETDLVSFGTATNRNAYPWIWFAWAQEFCW